MSYNRDLVILTKSAKNGANCVAGIDVNTGKWVRLVKNKDNAIPNYNMVCDDGHICEPLDVVRVTFSCKVPSGCQTENEQIHDFKKWEYLDTWELEDVLDIHPAEIKQSIFGNQRCTLFEDEKDNLDYSLMIIKVSDLKFYTASETGKTKAAFVYNGYQYNNISVTDRDFFGFEGFLNSAFVVMSIPNSTLPGYNYFKFIAKVFI